VTGQAKLGSADERRHSAASLDVRTKRIYEQAEPGDGYRILIDHVWPRGVSRERAHLDEWARELAPSDQLRKFFDRFPVHYETFVFRYGHELSTKSSRLEELRRRASTGPLTILFTASDQAHNHAIVLADLLRDDSWVTSEARIDATPHRHGRRPS
jgi:uncharacterized protein YeaO (DUF488 family)